MRTGFIVFIFIITWLSKAALAAEACVNDPQGTRGAQNESINNSLQVAQDPLTKAFLAANVNDCPPAHATTKTTRSIAKVINTTLGIEKIKGECIKASLQREVKNKGYSCMKGKAFTFENSGIHTACINEKTFNFIQFSVNQALACMSPLADPIDPRFILKKINNETGFNFYLGYSGGVGMGQLTSNPVNELAGWWEQIQYRNKKNKITRTENKFIPGNARYILDDLTKSNNPACAPFKKIIEQEISNPPPSPGSKANYCHWVSAGEGVGRSLVYGLGYYVYSRDHFIKEALREKAPGLMNNKEVVNSLTLVAYGPGGPAQAKALIRKLRLSDSSNPQKVIQQIAQYSDYVAQTNDKMKELYNNLKRPQPASAADLRGDTCVSR